MIQLIQLDYKDKRPIYQQLIEKIEDFIVTGMIAPNQQLPSVRTLAMDLSINPNTIQRAYAQLEKDDIIYTVPGKGCFASPATDFLIQSKQKQVFRELEQLVEKARQLNISEDIFIRQCVNFFNLENRKDEKNGGKQYD